MPTLKADLKFQLLISDTFVKEAHILCKKFSTVEWSGIVLYEVRGGLNSFFSKNIYAKETMKNDELMMIAHHIIPMDKGSAAYTSYAFTPDVIKYMNKLAAEKGVDPKSIFGMRLGHVHSHVQMSTFFSATDDDELSDNVNNHNGYLSIITNNRQEYNAKLAVYTQSESVITNKYRDFSGQEITSTSNGTQEGMVLITPEIVFEKHEDNYLKTFQDAIDSIEKKKKNTSVLVYSGSSYGYSNKWNKYFNGEEDEEDTNQVVTRHSNRKKNDSSKVKDVQNQLRFFLYLLGKTTLYEELGGNFGSKSLDTVIREINSCYSDISREDKQKFFAELAQGMIKAYMFAVNSGKDFDIKDKDEYLDFLTSAMSFLDKTHYKKTFTYVGNVLTSAVNSAIQKTKKFVTDAAD